MMDESNLVFNIFQKIKNSNNLAISIKSQGHSKMDWNYYGIGNIVFKKYIDNNNTSQYKLYHDENILLNGSENFTDKKLWIYETDKLHFFRYRNGLYEKIITFTELKGELISKEDYICGDDCYSGKIYIKDEKIVLEINILGLKKHEKIIYNYY